MKPLDVIVYEFKHYRPYLVALLGQGRTGRRQNLARFLGCPPSHISQVLKEKTHLTPEQGERAARFLQLSAPEIEYFLTLIHHDRAGTHELKTYYQNILNGLQREHLSVSGRMKSKADLPEDAQAKYYSSWIYLAIHLAAQLPQIHDRAGLVEYLRVEPQVISEALDFLMKNGIVVQTKNGLQSGPFNLFLSQESANLNNHHLNWRTKSASNVLERTNEDLHYSSAFTASRATALKIKQMILALIESNIELIRASSDEDVFVFTADFFKI